MEHSRSGSRLSASAETTEAVRQTRTTWTALGASKQSGSAEGILGGMPESEATGRLLELEREMCIALLGRSTLGRIAVSPTGWNTAPVICPVNYVYDPASASIVFRSGRGTKLTALLLAEHAAFEIDGIDPDAETGWSVIASGQVEEITNAVEIERLDRLGLHPWAPGAKPHWMRLRATVVSGRRIVISPDST